MKIPMNRRNVLATGTAAAVATQFSGGVKPAKAAKQGGHLRIGMSGGSTSDSLDGATHTDAFMQMMCMGGLFDLLTEVAADGSLKGELAESWEASADAKKWTFNLKKGVTFHNGKTMDADDVIASLNHHVKEDSKSAAKPIIGAVTEMKKDGPHSVSFTLENGNADFPYLLSDYHLLIYPADDMEGAMRNGIGTGGYTLESFEPGVSGRMKKNPNDYRSDRCHFDEVSIIGISDPTARSNSLVTGEVDLINKVDPKTAHLLGRQNGVSLSEVTGNQHFTFPMHTNTAPFDNNDLRLALKLAIDREEMVQKVLKGHGAVGNDHPIGPANQYFAADLEQRAYDPEQAKFHLKKAGYDSISIPLSVADAAFPGAVDAGTLFKEQAAKAGITIDMIRESNDGYWSSVWLKKPFCACYWSGRATEDWMFATAYEAGVPWNDSYWEHERFNKLLVEARGELDSNRRGELYWELQKIVKDEGGVITPMFANYIDAKSDNLAHPEQVGNIWQMDGCRLAERWWFA